MLKGRAFWSLGNVYTALGDHQKAVQYAQMHLKVSKEIDDETGRVAASENLRDLQVAMSTQNSMTGEYQVLLLIVTVSTYFYSPCLQRFGWLSLN